MRINERHEQILEGAAPRLFPNLFTTHTMVKDRLLLDSV
jgi:hypothetical protein